jgi:hypothetical protein
MQQPPLTSLKTLVIAATAGALFTPSCGSDKLPKQYQLTTPRVLAITASNQAQTTSPEVSSTALPATVDVRAFISALDLGVELGTPSTLSVTYRIKTCADPGVGAGADPSCATATSDTGNLVYAFPSRGGSYTGLLPAAPVAITVPATAITGRSAAEIFAGVPWLVTWDFTFSNGATLRAFRRILVTSRTTLNQNPTITAITKDGSTLTAPPSDRAVISATLGSSNTETYTTIAGSDYLTLNENVSISWFSSQGALKYSRTTQDNPGNEYWPPNTPDRAIFITAIVRDDRGGVGILSTTTPTVGP